jgi:DeoR/GlpR family transcriptional regulator of sugar metabolism
MVNMPESTRVDRIYSLLRENGAAMAVGRIAEKLSVNEATVRRDLRILQLQNRVVRSYGTAQVVPVAQSGLQRPAVAPIHQALAAAGLAVLQTGDVVILPGGAVTTEMARRLGSKSSITVVTNSCAVFDAAKPHAGMHVLMVGGLYSPVGDCLYGHLAENCLRELRADIVFFEPSGLDVGLGFTHDNIVEITTLKVMLKTARRVVLLIRDGVIGKSSGAVVGNLDDVSNIVCAQRLSADQMDAIQSRGIEFVGVPAGQGETA